MIFPPLCCMIARMHQFYKSCITKKKKRQQKELEELQLICKMWNDLATYIPHQGIHAKVYHPSLCLYEETSSYMEQQKPKKMKRIRKYYILQIDQPAKK